MPAPQYSQRVSDEQHLTRDTEGRPSEVVGSWSNIDIRKAAEQAFHAAQAELERANEAKSALQFALSRLGSGDRFNIIEFNSVMHTLFDKPRPATSDNLDEAKKWVDHLRADGGTEMLPALEAALQDDNPKDEGTVRQVRNSPTTTSGVVTYDAVIDVDNQDHALRPGMTANIQIPVASADNVVAVPLAAVFTETSPETGQTEHYVLAKMEDGFERRPVRIGVSDYFYAEVQSGLSPGEIVATELPEAEKSRTVKNPLVMLPGGAESGGATIRAGAGKTGDKTNGVGSGPRPASGNRRNGT